jgi:hypothetical protein
VSTDPRQGPGPEAQPSEEELRAQLEEQLRQIRVEDVLLQTVVSLVNLSGQRLGLTPDTEDMRDVPQARLGIEAVRALLPLLEETAGDQMRPVRDALTQLQLAYARETGAAEPGAQPGEGEPPAGGEAAAPPTEHPRGPAQGREPPPGLWVPPGSQT